MAHLSILSSDAPSTRRAKDYLIGFRGLAQTALGKQPRLALSTPVITSAGSGLGPGNAPAFLAAPGAISVSYNAPSHRVCANCALRVASATLRSVSAVWPAVTAAWRRACYVISGFSLVLFAGVTETTYIYSLPSLRRPM